MSSYHYLRGTEDDAKRDQEFLDKIDREGARAPRIRQVKTTSDISSDWDLFETLSIIWILHERIINSTTTIIDHRWSIFM